MLPDNELVRTQTGHHEFNEKHVHLQPEPSADPADPLNFSMTRKITILSIMSIYAFVANFSSSVISSALPNLITAFATFPAHGPPTGLESFSTLVQLVAVNSLMLGAANVFIVPLGNIFGRRPLILVCLAMLTGFSIWCAEAKTFNSLLAARVLQGIGGAAADTLAPDVVGHIFFTHQRGRGLAVYTVFLSSGSLVGGIAGGYITASLGWRWTQWVPAIMAAILFVLSVFFLPETMFDREAAMRTVSPGSYEVNEKTGEKTHVDNIERVDSQVYAPYTYARSLGFMKPRSGLLRAFFRPYLTLRLPGTIMVMLHYAGLVGLIVTISTVAPTILASPPYLWGASVGLISLAGLIGTLIGGVYAYFTTDWLAKRAAKHESHGYSEPEKRLPLMIPSLIIVTAGSLVFGFVAQNPSPLGWVGLGFGYGMIAFGLMQVPAVGFNYIIEAYGDLASDCCKFSLHTHSLPFVDSY